LSLNVAAEPFRAPGPKRFDLPASGMADVLFRFPVRSSQRFFDWCTITAEADGKSLRKQQRISLPALVLAAPARKPVKIDGDPSEWAQPSRESAVEQDDLAAWRFHKVVAAYDERQVCLAVSAPKGSADELVIHFDLDNDGTTAPEDVGIAIPVSAGPCKLVRLDASGKKRLGEVAGAACYCAERAGEGATEAVWEIALPRRLFAGRVAPGSAVGFGVLFRGARPCGWPPGFDGNAATAGEIAFTWRARDGSYPQFFKKDLPRAENVHAVLTAFPDGAAFMYEIFASEKEKPSADLASADWKLIVPLKIGSGRELDAVDVTARHFVTRLSNMVSDSSFEELARKGPVKLERGREDIQVWQADRPYCTTSETVSHSGRASAYIPATGRTSEPRNRWSNWRQILPAKPETEYTLSGYVRVEKMNDGTASLAVHSFSSRGGRDFSIHGPAPADAEVRGWQRLTKTFKTAPGEDRIRIFCDISLNGSAWFDDVHVIEGPVPADIAEIIEQRLLRTDGTDIR